MQPTWWPLTQHAMPYLLVKLGRDDLNDHPENLLSYNPGMVATKTNKVNEKAFPKQTEGFLLL